jgi:diguanylate cyclase (GGDEF)-like protein
VSAESIPFVVDEQALEHQERALAASGEGRLPALVSLAWHLRQRDGKRAAELAREARQSMAQGELALGESNARTLDLRLTLVDAEIHWGQADFEQAQRLVDEAMTQARDSVDLAAAADAHWIDASLAGDLGETARRDESLQACEALARRLGDEQRMLIAQGAMARWAVFSDPGLARERWGSAFGDGRGPWPLGVATWVADFLGNLAFSDGDNGPAILQRLRVHEDALASGQLVRAVIALTNIGACFSNLNDHDSSLIWMERGLEEARRLGWPMVVAGALLQVGGTLPPLGRLDTAFELLQEARGKLAIAPRSRNLVLALHYLGEVLNLQGKHAQALDVLAELEMRAVALNQSDILMEVGLARATAMAGLGRRDEALALANEALAACRAFNRRVVEIRALMELARLHTTLPAGEASAVDHAAALACLREAVTISNSIEGYQIAGDLYDALAREHAHAGEFAVAYEVSRQAAQAREATISTAALNRSIAMQIGLQTERTRAEAELQRSLAATLQQTTAMLETLGAIGQEITRHLDEQAVFDILSAHVHELLDATHFSVWALAAEDDALELVFGIDQGKAMAPGRRLAMDHEHSNIVRCARAREEILLREATPGFNPNHMAGTIPSASALFAPLVVGDSLLGVMSIQSPKPQAYGERERLIFRTLCAYGAIGLHNSRAYKLLGKTLGELQLAQDELARKNALLELAWRQQQEASFTDPLTQLRNRRFLMAHVEDEIALTLRRFERPQRRQAGETVHDHDLVFYMLDIDYFKAVNDQHGHAAGDAVLVEMARRLRGVIRESDFLIRWGGEEFLLVARATHAGDATVLAGRLRAVVTGQPFDLGDGKALAITCSIGFASFPFYAEEPRLASWSEVTRLADQALYLAKQEGRDRWIGVEARSAPTDRASFEQICGDPRTAQERGDIALLRSAAGRGGVSGSP